MYICLRSTSLQTVQLQIKIENKAKAQTSILFSGNSVPTRASDIRGRNSK